MSQNRKAAVSAISAVDPRASSAPLTPFHERLLAEELTLKSGNAGQRLAAALADAKVDMNPHQVEAAAFALDAMSRGGCMLADEVGLGKTIESGIVIGQLVAEGKGRILILSPATLRAQWQAELREKFDVESVVVDGRTVRASGNPFDQPFPVICSHPFAANRPEQLNQIPWDLVVIDEAHRLRNAYKASNKTARGLRMALAGRPKLLLTATPLQNDLMELFGLMSFLDEEILGPEHAFRARYALDPEIGGLQPDAARELQSRLAPVVHRTLRRQVREYVRYTNRRSVVEDFAPSPEEQDLYEKVSEYLRRSEVAAIEPGKKTLLTLVYRKLLASSTYAIAPTLRRLAENLRRRLASAQLQQQALSFFEPEEVKQYSEEAEEWSDEPGKPASLATLQNEVWELEQYADLADSITVNAKGEALKRALDRLFTVARAHQWPEKAVVFTESRRTQDYLFSLLENAGWKGKVSLLSGDAGSPEERRQLVQDFREKTQILISTEAGAEGLNLQFCNLVVNYDLPWNPQRVEQRIGRCHRYGQKHDVLVLNFLNRQNAADARLFELLEKKLNLFDGVFGASDEILGALENGVDFERRVLEIYQSCRKPEEIEAAFNQLRNDLETRIDRRMTDAQSLLLERFDGDVRRRLRMAGEQTREVLEKRRRGAKALTGSVLGKGATAGRLQVSQAAYQVRERQQDPVTYVSLDASGLPSRLARLAGSEGWWFCYRWETTGLKPEERLVHLVLLREKDGTFRALPLSDGDHFMRLSAKVETRRRPEPISVTLVQEKALMAAKEEILREAERRTQHELDLARDRSDRFCEDCLLESREKVDRARDQWTAARAEILAQEDPTERIRARAQADKLEREYRRKLASLRNEEEKRYAAKDRSLSDLRAKARVEEKRALVASSYFWLD
ncbi:MAG TPA: SNF2-related protein [Myxococcaceae bacterium]|nr:SNF2-related protein [Myxococcaceae bacterium]